MWWNQSTRPQIQFFKISSIRCSSQHPLVDLFHLHFYTFYILHDWSLCLPSFWESRIEWKIRKWSCSDLPCSFNSSTEHCFPTLSNLVHTKKIHGQCAREKHKTKSVHLPRVFRDPCTCFRAGCLMQALTQCTDDITRFQYEKGREVMLFNFDWWCFGHF